MNERHEPVEEALGPEEIAKRADELARIMGEVAEREIGKELGTKIDELKGRGRELAREIRARRTILQVEVKDVRNEEDGTIETVRMDTGELVRSRRMTTDERQTNLLDLRKRKDKGKSDS